MFMETFRRIHVRDVQNLQNNPLLRWLFGLVYLEISVGSLAMSQKCCSYARNTEDRFQLKY